MLLQLPKDVLSYILSIAVYDYFLHGDFILRRSTFAENMVVLAECEFHCCYENNNLCLFMRTLASVHPLIRRLLIGACKSKSKQCGMRKWGFKKHFFNELVAQNNRKQIKF